MNFEIRLLKNVLSTFRVKNYVSSFSGKNTCPENALALLIVFSSTLPFFAYYIFLSLWIGQFRAIFLSVVHLQPLVPSERIWQVVALNPRVPDLIPSDLPLLADFAPLPSNPRALLPRKDEDMGMDPNWHLTLCEMAIKYILFQFSRIP